MIKKTECISDLFVSNQIVINIIIIMFSLFAKTDYLFIIYSLSV